VGFGGGLSVGFLGAVGLGLLVVLMLSAVGISAHLSHMVGNGSAFQMVGTWSAMLEASPMVAHGRQCQYISR